MMRRMAVYILSAVCGTGAQTVFVSASPSCQCSHYGMFNLCSIFTLRIRPIVRCLLLHFARFDDLGLIVCSSTRLEDVPCADSFSVEDTIVVSIIAVTSQDNVLHTVCCIVLCMPTEAVNCLVWTLE